jgi:hypothetical protein
MFTNNINPDIILGMVVVAVKGLLHNFWNGLGEEATTSCSFAFSKAVPIPGVWRFFSTDQGAGIEDFLGQEAA